MVLAKVFVQRLKKERIEAMKKSKKPKKVDSITSPEVPLEKRNRNVDKEITKEIIKETPKELPKEKRKAEEVVTKKSNDATFITKKQVIETPVKLDDSEVRSKQDQQQESLKKATSKPTFAKKKMTSKPF